LATEDPVVKLLGRKTQVRLQETAASQTKVRSWWATGQVLLLRQMRFLNRLVETHTSLNSLQTSSPKLD